MHLKSSVVCSAVEVLEPVLLGDVSSLQHFTSALQIRHIALFLSTASSLSCLRNLKCFHTSDFLREGSVNVKNASESTILNTE